MTTPEHRLVWEFDRDSVNVRAVCDAAKDADCRMKCPEGCEQWGQIRRHEDVTFDGEVVRWASHDDCPAVISFGVCNVCEFLNNDDAIHEIAKGSPRFTIGSVAFTPEWEGDYYEWAPVVEGELNLGGAA